MSDASGDIFTIRQIKHDAGIYNSVYTFTI